jgi:membrane protein implicated in regulation of membrane protease activity
MIPLTLICLGVALGAIALAVMVAAPITRFWVQMVTFAMLGAFALSILGIVALPFALVSP